MTRFDALLEIYSNLDSIYAGLILLSVWVALTGHLVDWMTERMSQVIITIYWTLAVIGYVAGIIFIGKVYA